MTPELFIYGIPAALGFFLIPALIIAIMEWTWARPGYEQEWCQQLAQYAGHEGVIVLNCGREGFLVCLHTTDIPVLMPCHFEALGKTRTINRWAPTIITQKENLV